MHKAGSPFHYSHVRGFLSKSVVQSISSSAIELASLIRTGLLGRIPAFISICCIWLSCCLWRKCVVANRGMIYHLGQHAWLPSRLIPCTCPKSPSYFCANACNPGFVGDLSGARGITIEWLGEAPQDWILSSRAVSGSDSLLMPLQLLGPSVQWLPPVLVLSPMVVHHLILCWETLGWRHFPPHCEFPSPHWCSACTYSSANGCTPSSWWSLQMRCPLGCTCCHRISLCCLRRPRWGRVGFQGWVWGTGTWAEELCSWTGIAGDGTFLWWCLRGGL